MEAQSASTVVSAIFARSVVGLQSASTVVSADTARSAVGLESASTVVSAIIASSVEAMHDETRHSLRKKGSADDDKRSACISLQHRIEYTNTNTT